MSTILPVMFCASRTRCAPCPPDLYHDIASHKPPKTFPTTVLAVLKLKSALAPPQLHTSILEALAKQAQLSQTFHH